MRKRKQLLEEQKAGGWNKAGMYAEFWGGREKGGTGKGSDTVRALSFLPTNPLWLLQSPLTPPPRAATVQVAGRETSLCPPLSTQAGNLLLRSAVVAGGGGGKEHRSRQAGVSPPAA